MILEKVNKAATYVDGPKEELKKATSKSANTVEEPLQRETNESNSAANEGVTHKLCGPRNLVLGFEMSKQFAFLESIPEEFLVKVPQQYHKHITSERGRSIRTRAEQCEVTIIVPHASTKSHSITLRGPPSNCAEIKKALFLLVEDLRVLDEERKCRGYRETIRIDSLHYRVLVGRQGIGITKYHRRRDVDFDLPDKECPEGELEIAISGYKDKVKAAKEDTIRFLAEFDTR